MKWILDIPLELRLAGLFFLGACVGSWLNLAIDRFAGQQRAISPWSRVPAGAPSRRWTDRIPIVGWLSLRGEEPLHGRGFWVRPLAVEILTGLLWAVLYWWEVDQRGLLLPAVNEFLKQAGPARLFETARALHWMFLAHALLVSLMIVATMIDIDERIIPDEVTIPGVLLGLALAAAAPQMLLPDTILLPMPGGPSLAAGLGCLWLWCIALLPRIWRPRHGWRRAWGLMVARAIREPVSKWILLIGLVGSVGIALVWRHGGSHWAGLLTALVGMAGGGGLIWFVRIIGGAVLDREAMGFGDVTLMAMIGAFLGWQAALFVFFLAPMAGVVVGIGQWLLNRGHEIPYGPFLCLGAIVVIFRWAIMWERTRVLFNIGWLVPISMAVCLVAIVPLLFVVRFLGDRIRGG